MTKHRSTRTLTPWCALIALLTACSGETLDSGLDVAEESTQQGAELRGGQHGGHTKGGRVGRGHGRHGGRGHHGHGHGHHGGPGDHGDTLDAGASAPTTPEPTTPPSADPIPTPPATTTTPAPSCTEHPAPPAEEPSDEPGSDDSDTDEQSEPEEGSGGSASPPAGNPTSTPTATSTATTPPPDLGGDAGAGSGEDDWWGEPGICGDGLYAWNESCDDGNVTSGDGCNADCSLELGAVCNEPGQPCRFASCGDGFVDYFLVSGAGDSASEDGGATDVQYISESCDDGNATAGDGCDTACNQELGWVCGSPGSACHLPECGDGQQDGWLVEIEYEYGDGEVATYLEWKSEGCDDGNAAGGDGCSNECVVESGYACVTPGQACHLVVCGDGIQDYVVTEGSCDFADDDGSADGGVSSGTCTSYDWESCDDGNAAGGDGCDTSCAIEEGWVCEIQGQPCRKPVCGDGTMDWGFESCEDSNTEEGDGCNADCQVEEGWACNWWDGGDCRPVVCGDGIIDWNVEDCEDGNDVAGDGCSASCVIEAGWACDYGPCHPIVCGDGIVDWQQESCDDGNLVSGDGCSETCVYESAGCEDGGMCSGVCGDGMVDEGEQCDNGMNNGSGECTAVCTVGVCGDGVVQPGEECDDGNSVNGDSCSNTCQE